MYGDLLSTFATIMRHHIYRYIRCIVFRHLTRIEVWHLREIWDHTLSTKDKIEVLRERMTSYEDPGRLSRDASTMDALAASPVFAHRTTGSEDSALGADSFRSGVFKVL